MSVKRTTVEERKALPLASGVLDYFPDALLVVAEVSRVGNEQHHPGEPLHWDKSKSSDEADALLRHLLDRGTIDTDGLRHSGKVAWRALAMLQRELDAEAAAETAAEEQLWLDAIESMKRAPIMPYAGGPPSVTYMGVDLSSGVDDYVTAVIEAGPQVTYHGNFPFCHDGDGIPGPNPTVEYRGEWPPDTRIGGLLTCCGQSEHPLDCPHYRD